MNIRRLRPRNFQPPFLLFIALACFFPAPAFSSDVQKVDPDDIRKLIKQSDKHLRRGDHEAAEVVLKRALAVSPKHADARLKLAFVYTKMRRLREAYDLSFEVAEADPKNPKAFAVLGVTLLGAGRFPEARTVFVNALRLNKKEALAWAGMGMLEFYENRIDQSLLNLREAIYYEPEEPDYVFAFAQVSARAERYANAAEAYYRFLAISRNTDDERRARIRGLINFLRYLGQKDKLYTTSGDAQTAVPFELIGNRPVISVRLNDRPETLRFVLDTGSGISVISDETADKLGIDAITKGGFARGIGGDGRFEIVYGFVREFDIGNVEVRNVPVYIRKFHNTNADIDGYIGLSLISKFLTTVDYGRQTFALTKKDETGPAPKEGEVVSLPLRLTSSGFLSGEVQLEGVDEPLNFIVDTGASVSVISDDMASHDAISGFELGEKMNVIGAAGVTEGVSSFVLPKVSFGSHSRKSITAIALDLDMINETSGFEQAGILGGNFLRNYRMTFDFKQSKVTFVPINTEP